MNMPVDTLADPIAAHAHAILAHIGEDPQRPGLADTPKRFAAALRALTEGYEAEPEDVIGRGLLEEGRPFLQKPCTPRELARKVREVLDGAASAKDEAETV